MKVEVMPSWLKGNFRRGHRDDRGRRDGDSPAPNASRNGEPAETDSQVQLSIPQVKAQPEVGAVLKTGATITHISSPPNANAANSKTVTPRAGDNLVSTSPVFSTEVWEEAYASLDSELVQAFEDIVAHELNTGSQPGEPLSRADATSPSALRSHAGERRLQMASLVASRRQKAQNNRAAGAGLAVIEVADKFKDKIGASLEAYPPAALAFSGVSLLLNVSIFILLRMPLCKGGVFYLI